MKTILITLIGSLLLGITQSGTAQTTTITFGIRGGAGISLLSYDTNINSLTEGSGTSSGFSFNVSGLMNIQLNKRFAIQPELVYCSESAQNSETFVRVYSNGVPGGKTNYAVSRMLTTINVPILFKRTIGEPKAGQFNILAGPSVGLILSLIDQERIDPPVDKQPSVVNYDMTQTDQIQYGLLLGADYRILDEIFMDIRLNYNISRHLDTPSYYATFSNVAIGIGCLF
ncbi:MAG: PorT family protein [Ignavibacteriae bacterium]|nr:PorT family protein [Ignavibacteriota bacterium]